MRNPAAPNPDPPHASRRGARLPIALFLIALAARLAFLALEPRTRLAGDERTWVAAATEVSAARFDPLRTPLSFYPPLHPYLVAAASALGGGGGVRLAQALLGALLVPAVFAVGARAFDRRTAGVAAAVAALHPELVWQSVHLWSEPLFMALLWAAMAGLLSADASGRAGTAALAGAALGLAALTRDPALYFAPLAALWLVAHRPRPAWRPAAAFLLAALVVVLPWTARNWARFDTLIPVSLMGARTFWEANARQHEEVIATYAAIEQAEGPLAAYRRAWREGWAAVRERQPWWLVEQMKEQLPRFWTASSLPLMHLERRAYGDVVPWIAWAVLLATAVPHVVFTAAFILGVVALPWTRPRLLLLLFFGYYQLLHVVTLGHPRLRLPVLPVVFLFAAALFFEWRSDGLRWTPVRVTAVALLLAAFALCLVPDVRAVAAEPAFGLSGTAAPPSPP